MKEDLGGEGKNGSKRHLVTNGKGIPFGMNFAADTRVIGLSKKDFNEGDAKPGKTVLNCISFEVKEVV